MKYIVLFSVLFFSFQLPAQQKLTNEDIWNSGKLNAGNIRGFNFMNDGETYSRQEGNLIKQYSIITGNETGIVFNPEDLPEPYKNLRVQSYDFSADESKIILKTNIRSLYRHSYFAEHYIYDRKNKTIIALDKEEQQLGTLSPDNSKVAFVQKNNLYYLDLHTNEKVQITSDGEFNKIINGAPDWVYEEEFSFSKAFEWSPDSKKIAYLKFNESNVKQYTIEYYNPQEMYPEQYTFKYPKVGEDNSIVTLHVYHLDSKKTTDLNATTDAEQYLPRIKWTTDPNELTAIRLNRHQNHLELLLFNIGRNETPTKILEEKSKYYVDIHDHLQFLSDGKRFLWTSEKDGYNHIYLYNKNGKLIQQVTKGNYDVTTLYGLDEKNAKVYFQAAMINPQNREIYEADLNTNAIRKLSEETGTHTAQYSTTFDYWVNSFSTINTPPEVRVRNRKGDEIRILETNDPLKAQMQKFKAQKAEFFQFVNRNGDTLNGYMIRPDGFSVNEKYPVLMHVYGGPGSQQVLNSWRGSNYWWHQLLTQKGYIVVCIDNRGTGARGEEFKKMTYLQLGKYETEDQIDGAGYLASLNYVNGNRIGIWGWSYGGYMSTLCLLKGADVFKAAIAVAPVTNWKWYDSIYTERYMRTQKENRSGYEDNSPVNFAHLLKGNYLIIHGLADDNVHPQHAIEMTEALIQANKQFDALLYPNRNHGIYGNNGRLHLYDKMTRFLTDKL